MATSRAPLVCVLTDVGRGTWVYTHTHHPFMPSPAFVPGPTSTKWNHQRETRRRRLLINPDPLAPSATGLPSLGGVGWGCAVAFLSVQWLHKCHCGPSMCSFPIHSALESCGTHDMVYSGVRGSLTSGTYVSRGFPKHDSLEKGETQREGPSFPSAHPLLPCAQRPGFQPNAKNWVPRAYFVPYPELGGLKWTITLPSVALVP